MRGIVEHCLRERRRQERDSDAGSVKGLDQLRRRATTSSVITCTEPPADRYGHTSQPQALNAAEATWLARSRGVTAKAWTCQADKLARPRWGTTTPFGTPVEPEV